MHETIRSVRAATIVHTLQAPIILSGRTLRHREFMLARVDTQGGSSGLAYGLTRDGPVASIVDRSIAPVYVGRDASDPEAAFQAALLANNATHRSGVGMRALSVVDLATWDLAAKLAGRNIARFLGGELCAMPVIGIVGYPPTIGPNETVAQIGALWDRGWRRFKLPTAPNHDRSIERLRAARRSFPAAWLAVDGNFGSTNAHDAIRFGRQLGELDISWYEDPVPPGDAEMVAAVRAGIEIPVAIGDDQGGSYFPQALLDLDALDVCRVDATTNGGISGLRRILPRIAAAGKSVSPHMFPHVHSQVLAALGCPDAPIEWGIPGTGVHPMDESLAQPTVADGLMEPLADLPGFGNLVDPSWVNAQVVHDPDHLLADLH